MPVTKRLMKPGDWAINLRPECPLYLREKVAHFDHIVITPTRLNPVVVSDTNMLTYAAYVGVIVEGAGNVTMSGHDLSFWLETPDGLGDILDTAVSNAANSTLSTWWTSLKPSSIATGTITNGGTTTGTLGPYQYVGRREAWDAVCRAMGAEWQISNAGSMNAAIQATLFPTVTTPVQVITRNPGGPEGSKRGVESVQLQRMADVRQYTTSAIVVANGLVSGSSSSGATTYKDLFNNNVVMERLVNAPSEPGANAATVAAAVLAQFSSPREQVTLTSRTYSVGRDVDPGDFVYVYDRWEGITDTANQVPYRGKTIFPKKLRVYALHFPIESGMGVYARRSGSTATYTDLTDWVEWETGDVAWEVGTATLAVANDTASAGNVAYLGANQAITDRATSSFGLNDYVAVTADQATITTVVDLTNLTLTYTAVAGRRYRITAKIEVTSTAADGAYVLALTDSGGTAVQRSTDACLTTSSRTVHLTHMEAPTGSTTRKLRLSKAGGTGSLTMGASATAPAFLMVEDLGID